LNHSAKGSATIALPPFWLLIIISATGPLVLNGVLPANTTIMAEFETNYGTVQLVLSFFLLALLFGQILLGNAADRFGRRPIMLLSLIGFSIGSLLCAVAPNIESLLAARCVQGFFAASSTFLPRAMVRDVFGPEKSASMMGYMTVAMMVAPMFGPAIGGFITDNFSWRLMYAGLAAIGTLLCLFSWLIMHETRSASTAASNRTSLLRASKDLLQIRAFIACTIMLSGSIGIYYAFLAGSPFVMMEAREYSASEFGAWFAVVPIGYLSGNFIAGRFSERLGINRMIFYGAFPGLFGVCLLWLLSFSTHPLSLFIPMNLVALSNGMSLPNLMSAAMSVRSDLVSSAAGLSGAIQTGFGVVLTFALGLLLTSDDNWLNIAVTFSAALWICGLCLWFGNDKSAATRERGEATHTMDQ